MSIYNTFRGGSLALYQTRRRSEFIFASGYFPYEYRRDEFL